MHAPPEVQDDRDLSNEERRLVAGMLTQALPEPSAFLEQLRLARVVSCCPCGCASINFGFPGRPPPAGPMRVLADFVFGDAATLCGAFVFEQGGILAGLEVYGLALAHPDKLPVLEELRPFSLATGAG
jgi:hypothetical protein